MLQNAYNTTHLTLGRSLHYIEKLKTQISCRLQTVPVSRNVFTRTLLTLRSGLCCRNSVCRLSSVTLVHLTQDKKTEQFAIYTVSQKTSTFLFLPERHYVTFGFLLSQFRLSVVCLSVVCLSSVTLVHPTQGVEAFGKISSPLCTLAIP